MEEDSSMKRCNLNGDNERIPRPAISGTAGSFNPHYRQALWWALLSRKAPTYELYTSLSDKVERSAFRFREVFHGRVSACVLALFE